MYNGKFDPANLPPIEFSSIYPGMLRRINNLTLYEDNPLKLKDIYDIDELKQIKKKWLRVPLQLSDAELEEYFITGKDPRKEEPAEELVFEPKRKEEGVIHEGPDKEPLWKRAIKILPGDQSNLPIDTPPVSQEVVKTAALPSNINQKTGLTHVEEALLSNEEKAMRLRNKGVTA